MTFGYDADVLFGDVDPSGRLPLTYPRRESDVPVANPWDHIGNLDVRYREGVDAATAATPPTAPGRSSRSAPA